MTPHKKSDETLRSSFFWLTALSIASGFVTGLFSLRHGTLYWDTGRLFTQYRDLWQSLNEFGSVAWWFPHNQNGFPGYFQWGLNTASSLSPLAVAAGFAAWLLGRFGILVADFHYWYVIYVSFLTPAVFLSSLFFLTRHFVRDRSVSLFVLLLGAFSPAVLLNTSDIGFLEVTAYALFFFAATLRFMKRPNRANFLPLALASLVLTVSANNAYLYWNVIFVPLGLALGLSVGGFRKTKTRLRRAFRAVPNYYWGALALGIVICLLPTLFIYFTAPEIVRSSLGDGKSYAFEKLRAGNPLEWLTVSIPGLGFDWRGSRDHWTLIPFSTRYHAAYNYLGAASLPLALYGMIVAPRFVRHRIFAAVALMAGVICLSAFSPVFSSLLLLQTPLRFCNHFSDVSFKAGGFLLVLWSAAFGLRALLREKPPAIKLLFAFLGISGLLAIGANALVLRSAAAGSTFFGHYVHTFFLSTVALVWLVRARTERGRRPALVALLAVAFLDVSTHAFLYQRLVDESTHRLNSGWLANAKIDQTLAANHIGMRDGAHAHYYANHFLMLRPYYELLRRNFNPEQLPKAALYFNAHSAGSFDDEIARWKKGDTSLPLANVPGNSKPSAAKSADGTFSLSQPNFNEWEIAVRSPSPAWLFLRDAASPFWAAQVDGLTVPIERAFFNFKAVRVPAGTSRVRFVFAVPFLGWGLFILYAGLLLLSFFVVRNGLAAVYPRLRKSVIVPNLLFRYRGFRSSDW